MLAGNSTTVGCASSSTLSLPTATWASTGSVTFGASASDTGTVAITSTATTGTPSAVAVNFGRVTAGNTNAFGSTATVTIGASGTLQTLTTGGQNGKLTVAALAGNGGTIKIGG